MLSSLLISFSLLAAIGGKLDSAKRTQDISVEFADRANTPLKPRASNEVSQIELNVSSWAPESFAFERDELPSFGVRYMAPKFSFLPTWNLSLVAGVSFLTMVRVGQQPENLGQKQTALLLPAAFGIQVAPEELRSPYLRPYAQVLALPSLLISRDSPLANGSTFLGLPFEFDLGSSLPLWSDAYQLSLAAQLTAGELAHSNLFGWGISAGMRMSL